MAIVSIVAQTAQVGVVCPISFEWAAWAVWATITMKHVRFSN